MKYFSDNALDTIHSNIDAFTNNFLDNKNSPEWLDDFLPKNSIIDSGYSFDFDFMNNICSGKDYSYENSVKVYELLNEQNIGKAIIYTEKFLTGFMFTYGYAFFANRVSAYNKNLNGTFFYFSGGRRRYIGRNYLSRMYKLVDLTIDNSLEDKYELTKFLYENSTLERIVLYPIFDEGNNAKLFVRAFKTWKEKNIQNITYDLFELLRKHFSILCNVNIVENMTDDEVINYLLDFLNKN